VLEWLNQFKLQYTNENKFVASLHDMYKKPRKQNYCESVDNFHDIQYRDYVESMDFIKFYESKLQLTTA
jgi:hypothetical protein